MNYLTFDDVANNETQKEMKATMLEWCGATFFDIRYDKEFTVAEVVLNTSNNIMLRVVSLHGFEQLLSASGINYYATQGAFINLIKPIIGNRIKLVVTGHEEKVLGYINPKFPYNVNVLTSHSQYIPNGGTILTNQYRLASAADFDRLRTSLEGYENDSQYLYKK